jgi:hypothetical protein
MSNTSSSNVSARHTSPDVECRARADAYLNGLIGSSHQSVTWDATYRLQGHVQLGSNELVVIAPRDAAHEPVVLTAPGWDAVRRSSGDQRRGLIASCAITDHAGLLSALESQSADLARAVLAAA